MRYGNTYVTIVKGNFRANRKQIYKYATAMPRMNELSLGRIQWPN